MLLVQSRQTKIVGLTDKCYQPNAVDITLKQVYKTHGIFSIDEEERIHRSLTTVIPNHEGYFEILPRTSYQIEFDQYIEVAPSEAGFIIARSTLNRNDLFITSGLYDSGFKGIIAGALHNMSSDKALIKKGTRIAQFITVKSEVSHLYEGIYNKQ